LRRTRLSLAFATAAVGSAALLALPSAASAAPNGGELKKPTPGDVAVQIVAMNDFHGRIALTSGKDSQLLTSPGPDLIYGTADDVTQTVGGAANVAATVERLRSSFLAGPGKEKASWFVGAGDLVSASPFESSIFKDEPTIEVLNAMGLQVSSVGNHEFDHGTHELRRISAATDAYEADNGGTVGACDDVTPDVDGCFTDSHGSTFAGAQFPYLAANVLSKTTGRPLLPPYQIFTAPGGVKVAMIGVVTRTTPTIVSPQGVSDVTFTDEATAVNTWVPVLQRQGVQAIGVLIHEGGGADPATSPTPAYDGCSNLHGPITDINAHISDAVDLIVSAHTHQAYNCLLPVPHGHKRLVTQAGYYGRLLTDIRLSVDPRTGDVDRDASYQAMNVPVTRDAADAHVQSIVDYWTDRSADAGNRVIGSIGADITRAPSTSGESSLGNLVAQTQWDALQQDQFGRPVVAFMNPGGLRTDLEYASSPAGEGDGKVTYREAFNVQPFGNTVDAITLTGANLEQVLEQQFQSNGGPRGRDLVLGTSDALRYAYDLTKPYGSRVSDVTINGTPLDPTASYRVAANSFLMSGGDLFAAFTAGTDHTTGPVDVDTAVAYFEHHPLVDPFPADHATKLG
jgi:5'-nucleotidase